MSSCWDPFPGPKGGPNFEGPGIKRNFSGPDSVSRRKWTPVCVLGVWG